MKTYLLFAILIFASCKTKDVQHTVTTQSIDSVYLKLEQVVSPPIASEIVVYDICDTTGVLTRDFEKKLTVGKDTFRLWAENNSLRVNLKIAEKVISSKDSINQYSKKEAADTKASTIVITKSTKGTWILAFVVLLFIILPIIPSTIKSLLMGAATGGTSLFRTILKKII